MDSEPEAYFTVVSPTGRCWITVQCSCYKSCEIGRQVFSYDSIFYVDKGRGIDVFVDSGIKSACCIGGLMLSVSMFLTSQKVLYTICATGF